MKSFDIIIYSKFACYYFCLLKEISVYVLFFSFFCFLEAIDRHGRSKVQVLMCLQKVSLSNIHFPSLSCSNYHASKGQSTESR